MNTTHFHLWFPEEQQLIVGMKNQKCAWFLVYAATKNDGIDNVSPSSCLFCDSVLSWLYCAWYVLLCCVHSF